ncbi:MAG: acyltransferase [Prevotella sp.]|nr:acyltransferase [Prevotella sp.]
MDYMARRTSNEGTKSAPIVIEDDVWVGAHSIILKGVTIGARSIIGAGSVVTKNIPPDCVAGFSSRQTAERMQERFSGKNDGWQKINVIWCPEAVDDSAYQKGKLLKERNIDLLEFGRSNDKVFKVDQLESVIDNKNRNLNHVCTKQNGKFIYTNEQLYQAMGDAKVTIALPRSMTQPEMAGDIETLTQRYWECMFSRMVMVGHAPQELLDFIGYNPVIELREDISAEALIRDVLEHIDDYQELVDKNRETAERLGSWDVRIKWLMEELRQVYEVYNC